MKPAAASRRSFLRITAAIIVAGGGAAAGYVALNRNVANGPEATLIDWMRRNGVPGRALGRQYLADNPAHADAGRLAAAILGPDMPPTQQEVGDRLSARIADDYAAGRTSFVDGWMFSETEFRLSAIHLLAPR